MPGGLLTSLPTCPGHTVPGLDALRHGPFGTGRGLFRRGGWSEALKSHVRPLCRDLCVRPGREDAPAHPRVTRFERARLVQPLRAQDTGALVLYDCLSQTPESAWPSCFRENTRLTPPSSYAQLWRPYLSRMALRGAPVTGTAAPRGDLQ